MDVRSVKHIDPEEHLSAEGSMGILILASAVMLALAAAALVRACARQRLAGQAGGTYDPQRILAEGDGVICGVVEHAAGAERAVEVRITQNGTEQESSGSWSHRWTEIDRAIRVEPFYLRLDDGTRVRVEAPPDVDVADELDGKVLISRTERVLIAQLVPGERVFAHGELSRGSDPESEGVAQGYRRSAGRGWLLRATASGRMLLSSEPLGAGYRQRARFHRNHGLLALAALTLMHLACAHYYYLWQGHAAVVVIAGLNHRVVEDSDGDVHHFEVTVDLPDGRRGIDDASEDDWRALKEGDRVDVRVSGSSWQLGARPTLHFAMAILGVIYVGGIWGFYLVRRHQTRPWFRRKMNDQGSGRLPEPEQTAASA